MADVTLFELHLEDSTFDLNLPFSAGTGARAEGGDGDEVAVADDSSGGPGKGLAVVGVFVGLVVVAALVKHLRGGDDEEDHPEVDIETADDMPVGVAVDE